MMNTKHDSICHRVDSHQHFWMRSRGDYDWLTPDLELIYHDFMPSNLSAELIEANVTQTILVQAAETDAETDFMLSIAEQTQFVGGVVGWIDMESEDALKRIDKLSENRWFKGIRPMLQDMSDDTWMLRPHLAPVFEKLIQNQLSFDALVKPRHLPHLLELLKRYPELRVVIDHGAKPDIASGETSHWSDDIKEIATETQAYCKMSGLITEATAGASYKTLTSYLQHLLNIFGADRLMWGSDWPVLNLASNYLDWVKATEEFLSSLDQASQEKIWALTAQHFYKLES